ncbi:MAG: GAF domain-containing protein [Actinomycetota bacterium]|nr:GAF domain-containing protein [Actinomycetota bacterium]
MSPPPAFALDPIVPLLIHPLPISLLLVDPQLRVLFAGGRQLRTDGYESVSLTGQLLTDVMPADSLELFIGAYRAAFQGETSELVYDSPLGGGRYHVSILPFSDPVGQIVAAMSVSVDISHVENLEFELGQVRKLIDFGSGIFERRSGWTTDERLLAIWGLESLTDTNKKLKELMLPADRPHAEALWKSLRQTGGRGSLDYSIAHGFTKEVRHLRGTWDVSLDSDGAIVRVQSTHVDLTEVHRIRSETDRARVDAAHQREQLLRRVGGVLATTAQSMEDAALATYELALTAFGYGCGLRLFSPDGQLIERSLVGQAEGARTTDLSHWTRSNFDTVDSLPPVFKEAIRTQTCLRGRSEDRTEDPLAWHTGMRYLAAPIRHRGRVYGVLSVARAAHEPDFDAFEIDLAQLMADRLGAFAELDSARVAIDQMGELRARLGDQLQEVRADQQNLIVQLDQTESRERLNLAEALHDDPLQMVVAAMLQLDVWRSQQLSEDPAFERVQSMLETAVEQLRMVVTTLTPPDLTEGLGPALRHLAIATFFGSATTPKVQGPQHVPLDPKTKESVYRIVREALVNVRKHAHAKNVVIEISIGDDEVRISVVDDGIGIQHQPAAPGHLGLPSMRARAASAHADLVIASNVGKGTTVELVLHPQPRTVRAQSSALNSTREKAEDQ